MVKRYMLLLAATLVVMSFLVACGGGQRGGEKSDMVAELREYFGISTQEASDEELSSFLKYKDNLLFAGAMIRQMRHGRKMKQFLAGGSPRDLPDVQKDTLGYLSTKVVIGALEGTGISFLSSGASLIGVLSTVAKGVQVYYRFADVLKEVDERTIINDYIAQREHGSRPGEAFGEIEEVFRPSVKKIILLNKGASRLKEGVTEQDKEEFATYLEFCYQSWKLAADPERKATVKDYILGKAATLIPPTPGAVATQAAVLGAAAATSTAVAPAAASIPTSGTKVPSEQPQATAQAPATTRRAARALSKSENVEFVGQVGGASNAVAVQGNYAYIGEGPRLTIFDISHPDNVNVIGKTAPFPGIVRHIAVSGKYAYVAVGNSSLCVADVSNPVHPTEKGCYDTPGKAEGVAVAGKYAYVADGNNGGLRIIDVSDPVHPSEIGFYDRTPGAYGVAVAGNYAYVASSAGLRIIDVSDPEAPREVGSGGVMIHSLDVAVEGNYAYVVDDFNLYVFSVSDPAAPKGISHCKVQNLSSPAVDVVVEGGYAYVASAHSLGTSLLSIVDVSDPAHPAVVAHYGGAGYYDIPGHACGVAKSGNYVYVADGKYGLSVINVRDPAAPKKVDSYETMGEANRVAVVGKYAYVVARYRGLYIIDVGNPAAPRVIGYYHDIPRRPVSVVVARGYAYVASDKDGLSIVDVRDPAHPTKVGAWHTVSGISAVAVVGNYAYVVESGTGELCIIDVSNPEHPRTVGCCETIEISVGTSSVVVAGNYAYVARSYGLHIVDVSDPARPKEVGSYDAVGEEAYKGVGVAGNYAYVASSHKNYGLLRIIDVKSPTTPTEVNSYKTGANTKSVAVVQNYAYVTNRVGLRIVDVSNPAEPEEAGYYETPGGASGLAVAGSYVYVADGDGGLSILRYTGAPEQTAGAGTPTQEGMPLKSKGGKGNGTPEHTTGTETPTPACRLGVNTQLRGAWSRDKLGCATSRARVTWAAWEPFQGGYMLWRSDTDEVYIFYHDRNNRSTGRWWKAPKEWKWDGSNPGGVGMSPPQGLYEPKRGFGWLWRTHLGGPGGKLGWALDKEKGFCARIQPFEKGLIFHSSTVSCTNQYNWATHPSFVPLFFTLYKNGAWVRH